MRLLRAAPLRVLDDRDLPEAFAVLDRAPVSNAFVISRIRAVGLRPAHLGAEVWGYPAQGPLDALCYSGGNLIPLGTTAEALNAFAERARGQGRRCSSIVGQADAVRQLWTLLNPYWGPPRTVRECQPLMQISGSSPTPPDPLVRRVREKDLGVLLPACVSMFTEEVGVPPDTADGRGLYRARVAELIRLGRAFARIERGEVIFKAEIGAVTQRVCQVQGVWIHPRWRGRGLAAPGMAAVISEALRSIAPTVSLYVNSYNRPARAAYRRAGLAQTDTFMSVLF